MSTCQQQLLLLGTIPNNSVLCWKLAHQHAAKVLSMHS